MTTTVYLYAQVPTGEPRLRIGGNLRPSESALESLRNIIRQRYDPSEAEATLEAKAEALPQDRSPDDFDGSYVLVGLARFDKNTGQADYDPRDYEFAWGEMNLSGRDPSRCDKGYFESTDTYYTPQDEKPAGW